MLSEETCRCLAFCFALVSVSITARIPTLEIMTFRQLSPSAWVSAFVSSVVLAALALIVALKLTVAPSYSDFIVGSITWNAGTKLQDLIAAPVFVLTVFLCIAFFSFMLKRHERLFGSHYAIGLSNQLMWWSLPAVAAISSLILSAKVDQTLFIVSAAAIGFISLASIFCAPKDQVIDAQVLGLTALTVILLGLVPLELALLLGRAPISLVGTINIAKYEKATYVISVLGLLGSLLLATRWPQTLFRILPRLLLLGQIGLSTFFLTLYPARLLQPDGTLTKYETTVWLKLLVVGLILYGIFDVARRYRSRSHAGSLVELLSPIALFAVLVGLRVGNTVAPHISSDDYHFGESLLGWWSYVQGVVPYVGYVPAHGLIEDDLNRFLSSIFYDGSAGSVSEAGRLGYTVLAFAAFLSIYKFSGSIGLAFVAVFFLGEYPRWLFLTPFMCLWFNRNLINSPSKWLMAWLVTAPIVILGLPPQGILLVAASGVMAAYFCWHMWRHPETRKWTGVGVSLTTLIILGFGTPLGPMLLGAVRYVLENGPVNQVAYGMPWELSWNTGAKSGFVFEAIRMSWVGIPLGCLAIIFICSKASARKDCAILPAVVILLFALLLIPYSMGRIDPGGVSRPGFAAIFGWAILLPVAAWGVIKRNNRVLLFLLIAFTGASLGFSSLSFPALVSATSSKVSTAGVLKDGLSAGLTNIGKASVADDQWERLSRLNQLLAANLAPRETYLDLTSRNAQYFYLDRRPVVPVTAAYNMVPPSVQKRTVEELTTSTPKLALLEGANIIHDGGGLALRTPYLYRFVVENYAPRYESGFIIGIEKSQSKEVAASKIEVTVKNISDANWDRGVHRQDSAIVIDNPYLLPFLKVGDSVRVSGEEVHRISKIAADTNTIWFDGRRMEPAIVGHPNEVQVAVAPQVMAEYRQALFQAAFSQLDFQKIPVSWGRSEETLKKKMSLAKSLDEIALVRHQLLVNSGGYKVDGVDPSLSLDISNLGLSGRDAGLLRFTFSCINRIAEPRLQVFWWGDSRQGPFEASSIRFTADEGVLIVPLDASPRWLLLEHLKGIRIDLDNASACRAIKVKDIALYRRMD